MTSTSRAISLGALLFIAVTSLFIALLFGSVPLSAPQILTSLFSSTPGIDHDIVWKLRLPRALAAFACGGLLAISGVLLQVLLRNPLADPYVLGVSGGAALGALVALLLGAGGAAFLHLGALAGAFAAIAIVFALSFRAGDWNVHRLLLTGIVLSAGFTALISLLLVLAPQVQLRGMLFWLMGDLSDADNSTIAWIVLALVLALFIAFARNLDVLALGSLKARALGVAVAPLQAAIYFGAALATVAAVLLGGSIGFVGMMVPHALRLIGVHAHRWLLPGAALLGGSFVVLADTLARAAWAPQQLPVGVFTALIGVPALLILLSRKP
ncbi:MAG TPA: iron ABC transporter permease [Burkholderiales bacterium]|nr:iron ABC transporter permease [Burkholderiales bacterium]